MKTIGKTFIGVGFGLALAAAGAVVVLYSGVYDVAADSPHARPVFALLDTARERSVARRARALQVPAVLDDPDRIRQGAGNYDAMCVSCHLSPGSGESELSRGLYPAPPDLSREAVDAASAFWTIKHGIKASGMPAWGRSMEDEYIWNMVAFLRTLPTLDREGYAALVASSGGHSHGGGETGGHEHGGAGERERDSGAVEPPQGHVHADGSHHDHGSASSTAPSMPGQARPNDDSPDETAPSHKDNHTHER
ncbi:c-type cytochrome [Marilutibacter chinensis]|uniref:Cytochrome c n=1 Tax=Marilutibacter chinensis TaxID=2912247 RepID=A0ABS9HP95_9GAMM|nr:cytochrome c [Lysobacter chinensis]MCF7220408.1 cytochrome c [Lysobacter chinensis]